MKFKFEIVLFLLLLSPCFAESNTDAKTQEISLSSSGTININFLTSDSRLSELNFTAYVVPQNSQIVSYNCTNCNLTTDSNGVKFLTGFFSGNYEKIQWAFTATIIQNREINYISSTPSFPYQGSFPDNVKPYLEYTALANYDKNICAKASEIASGSGNYLEAFLKVAEYVYNAMDYDEAFGNKNYTATTIYSLKKGVCGDYSTLYISMLRCLGIPARFAAGYVYSNLYLGYGAHAWTEVYVPSYGWISVDPTIGEFGWLSPSHAKFETIDDASKSKSFAVNYFGYNVDVETSTQTALETTGTVEAEKEIDAVLNLSSEKIPVNSYVLASIEFPKQNLYIPLSVYLIKTKTMNLSYGNPVSYILLSPLKNEKKYFILKSPDSKLSPLQYEVHSINFDAPLISAGNLSVGVYPTGTSSSFDELKQSILLETTTLPSVKLNYKQINATYDSSLNLNFSIKNNGNTGLSNIEVILKVNGIENKTLIDELLISEELNSFLSLPLNLENNAVLFQVNYENNTVEDEWILVKAEKPNIEIKDLTPEKINQNENFTGVIVFSNPEKVEFKKIELTVSTSLSTASASIKDVNNSYNFTVLLKPENFEPGINDVSFYIVAEDNYGLQTEFLIKKQVNVSPSDIISFFKMILNRIIDFVFKLLGR